LTAAISAASDTTANGITVSLTLLLSYSAPITNGRKQVYAQAAAQKEGNQSVTKCEKLKLVSRDGKSYKTDVINTEQALRLIQSIPSPRVEPMKLWLAAVGTERLEEMDDPDAVLLRSIERATERYQALGKSESWITARIEGIVT
jgi:hypothetical protein